MKKVILATVLTLSMAVGVSMAQTDTSAPQDQNSQPSQGMMMPYNMMGQGYGMMNGQRMGRQGCGMMGGKAMMMQGRRGCMNMMGKGMGSGMMGGGMMTNMSPENQQKFMDASKDLRKEMYMMRFTHMEAMRNPKTSLDDLANMEQKMLDLRKQIMKKAEQFQDAK